MNTMIEDTCDELRCDPFDVFVQAMMLDLLSKKTGSRVSDAKEQAHRLHARWLNNRTITQEVEDFALSILRDVPKYKEVKVG